MNPTDLPTLFAARVRQLREAAGLSQEALAKKAGLHRTHVSLIERGKRVARLDTVSLIATALGVPASELVTDAPLSVPPGTDRAELERLWPALQEFQKLAVKHGIDDVFQDNGGKLLQLLILLNLQNIPGREGNDAKDSQGNEYELKTMNILVVKKKEFTTNHHLNLVILAKYRAVVAWYFAVYEHIELVRVYRVETTKLETYFKQWEAKWKADKKDLNNPKIPLKFVETNGVLVYPLTITVAPTP